MKARPKLRGTSGKIGAGGLPNAAAGDAVQMEMYSKLGKRRRRRDEGRLKKLTWLSSTERLLERHCKYGESLLECALDLGILLEVAEARIRETKNLAQLPIALKFRSKAGSTLKYPPALVHTNSRKMADELARRLSKLAKREPLLVESAVTTFVENIQESHLLWLTWRDWRRAETEQGRVRIASFRDVVQLVELLDVPGLTVQFVGYICCPTPHGLSNKLTALGARRGTKPHLIKPPNPKSGRNHEQLGIRVGSLVPKQSETQFHASEAFRHVLALAAICKIWEPAAQREGNASAGPLAESPFLEAELPLAADAGVSHSTSVIRRNSAVDGRIARLNRREIGSGADQFQLSLESFPPIAGREPEANGKITTCN